MIRSKRGSLVGSNGRITTRLLFGFRTIPVRRTCGGRRDGAAGGASPSAAGGAVALSPGPSRGADRVAEEGSVSIAVEGPFVCKAGAPDLDVRRIIGRGFGRGQGDRA